MLKIKHLHLLLLFSSLFILLGANLTVVGNAVEPIEGEADDFSYSYVIFNNEDENIIPAGNATMLTIDFGDGTIGDQINELRWIVLTESNHPKTGQMSMTICFEDGDGGSWNTVISQDVMTIFVNSTISGPALWGGDVNWTDFFGSGDVNYIKSQDVNVTDPDNIEPNAGIDYLKIKAPEINKTDSETELIWGLQYESITPWVNLNGTLDWTINASFIRNYTYHFYVKNQAAYLKTDVIYSNFIVHPDMRGTLYENGTLRAATMIIVQSDTIDPETQKWDVDGKELNENEYGPSDTGRKIVDKAKITTGDRNLSEIQFGSTFIINNETEKKIENFARVGLLPPDNYKELIFNEVFPGLNFSELDSIAMDPEVAFYFDSPSESSFPMEYVILIAVVACVMGIVIWKRRSKAKVEPTES